MEDKSTVIVRSLIYVWNSKVPYTEPYGTQVLIVPQSDSYISSGQESFSSTRCILFCII